MVQETARRNRRPPIEDDCRSEGAVNSTLSINSTKPSSPSKHHRRFFEPFVRCPWNFLARRTLNVNHQQRRRRSGSFFGVVVRRLFVVLCFLSVYFSVYCRLDEIERNYDTGHDEQHPKQFAASPENGTEQSPTKTVNNNKENKKTKPLANYMTNEKAAGASMSDIPNQPSLQEARKGREHITSILEDAGIEMMDSRDVLRLPLWSSVSGLYYNEKHSTTSGGIRPKNTIDGPIILGLEGCTNFRENVPPRERFLGVAGNFNSGTTAFGISLQKNCMMEDHSPGKNFVMRKRKSVFASNVNGMLSMVPWAKHKTADYKYNHTIHPPYPIDHDKVLPLVLVRDPFYWMQSMCKEGYGVRWEHDSKHHCPNLIPNDFDKKRFPKLAGKSENPVPVWMGANPSVGPAWPSLIHYWNAWYESYYFNFNSNSNTNAEKKNGGSSWPRLIIRFEDTLFYPKQVMEQVCHCGGGKLLSDRSFDSQNEQQQQYYYNLEEAKPEHKHQQKNNFVTAMIEYGTNATRLRNMTKQDIEFAIQHLNPTLMQAFGYSYPNTKEKKF